MKLFWTFLFIAFPYFIFAQANYRQGYVLKNNGDTLKGYINYREWTRCPASIEFKISKDDKKALIFNPKTINKFRIDGMDTYVTYKGPISTNITDVQYIKTKLDTGKKQDTVFLQQLATGKNINLFYYGDEIKNRFFIAETNEMPAELMYYAYYKLSQVVTIESYKDQLKSVAKKYIQQSDRLTGQINRARYIQPDLVNIADKINNNGVAIKKKSAIKFFAGLEVSSTKTTVNSAFVVSEPGNSTSAINNTIRSQTTVLPKISLGFDLYNNRNVQQFIFRAELALFYINPQIKYPNSLNTFDYYSVNQSTAAVIPQVIFNVFNKENFKVFIDAGFAFNFSTYSSSYKFTLVDPNKSPTQSAQTINSPFPFKHLWGNIPLKAGVRIDKNFELDLTYIGDRAFTDYYNITVSNQSLNLGVKYFFGKN